MSDTFKVVEKFSISSLKHPESLRSSNFFFPTLFRHIERNSSIILFDQSINQVLATDLVSSKVSLVQTVIMTS